MCNVARYLSCVDTRRIYRSIPPANLNLQILFKKEKGKKNLYQYFVNTIVNDIVDDIVDDIVNKCIENV